MELSIAIEIIGILSGLICVYLATKVNIHTWTFGIINVLSFGWIFWGMGLPWLVGLQAFFLIMSIIGIVQWNKPDTKKVSWWEPIKFTFTLVSILVLSILADDYIFEDGSLEGVDFTLAMLSIVATYLMIQKYIQSWILWIIVDVISILLFIYLQEALMIINFTIFLALSIDGYYRWKRIEKDKSICISQ